MVAKKDKDNRSADIAELVDKVLEVPVGCVDAGEIGVERAIGALAGSLDPIVCQLFGGNGADIVSAMVLHRDIEDELRSVVGPQQVEYLVIGGVVAYAGMVTGRTFEIADRKKVSKAQLLIDFISMVVDGVLRVHSGSGIPKLLKVLCQTVDTIHLI